MEPRTIHQPRHTSSSREPSRNHPLPPSASQTLMVSQLLHGPGPLYSNPMSSWLPATRFRSLVCTEAMWEAGDPCQGYLGTKRTEGYPIQGPDSASSLNPSLHHAEQAPHTDCLPRTLLVKRSLLLKMHKLWGNN